MHDVKKGLLPVDPFVVACIRTQSVRPGVALIAIREAAFEAGQQRVHDLGLPLVVDTPQGQFRREHDQRFYPSDDKIRDIRQKFKDKGLNRVGAGTWLYWG